MESECKHVSSNLPLRQYAWGLVRIVLATLLICVDTRITTLPQLAKEYSPEGDEIENGYGPPGFAECHRDFKDEPEQGKEGCLDKIQARPKEQVLGEPQSKSSNRVRGRPFRLTYGKIGDQAQEGKAIEKVVQPNLVKVSPAKIVATTCCN